MTEVRNPLRYSWIVTDLDGTLVDQDLTMVARSAAALQEFSAAGGQVLLATGRNERSAMPYYEALNLSTPLIVYNGARIVAPRGQGVLLDRVLEPAGWRALLTLVRALPSSIGVVAFVGLEAWVISDGPELQDYAHRDQIPLVRALGEHHLAPAVVTKVMLIAAPEVLQLAATKIADSGIEVTMVKSEATYLELLPLGVTKGTALSWLADRYDVDLKDVAAIGDNPNDLDMLQVAGLGAAVGDGHADVRAAADVVLGACRTGPLAELVRLAMTVPARP